MNDIIKVIPLGGLDNNGRDCYVIEINNDIFVLDAGLSLPDKSIPGIDSLLPNFEYLIKNKDRVKAYILGQGHDENIGALQYLYPSCPAPIYCSKTTADVLNFLTSMHHRIISYDFHIVNPTSSMLIANRRFSFFSTAHNVSETFGVCINTDKGNIIYTGDFIVEFSAGEKGFAFDLKALEPLASEPTFLLLSESKAAHYAGYCSPKHKITNLIFRKIANGDKRVFISCFWENFFRINEIIKVVKAAHKKLYFYNEYTRNIMENLVMKESWNTLTKDDIVSSEDIFRTKRENIVILILGEGEELYEEIGLIAANRNADKKIILDKDDIFINAAVATPTLETVATKNVDSLYRSGADVMWIKSKDVTAMHPRQDDLKFFLSFLKPKFYLPVRGTYVHMMDNAKLAISMGIGLNHMNVFMLDNGMTLSFDEQGKPRVLPIDETKVPIVPILVDGKGISKDGAILVEERKKLGVDGVVVIGASVSKSQRKIVAGPDCQMRGFVYVKEAEPMLKNINRIFIETIEFYLNVGSFYKDEIIEEFVDKCGKYIRRENGRDPMIIASIVEVE